MGLHDPTGQFPIEPAIGVTHKQNVSRFVSNDCPAPRPLSIDVGQPNELARELPSKRSVPGAGGRDRTHSLSFLSVL